MEVRLSESKAAENRTETCFLQTDKKRLQIHRQGMQLPERKIPAYKHSAWVLQKFRHLITVCPPVPMTGIFRTSGGGKIPSMRKPVCAFFYMPVPWCQGIRAAPLQFFICKNRKPSGSSGGFCKMRMLLWKRAPSGCLPALAADSPDRIRLPADAFCLGKEPLKRYRSHVHRQYPGEKQKEKRLPEGYSIDKGSGCMNS